MKKTISDIEFVYKENGLSFEEILEKMFIDFLREKVDNLVDNNE